MYINKQLFYNFHVSFCWISFKNKGFRWWSGFWKVFKLTKPWWNRTGISVQKKRKEEKKEKKGTTANFVFCNFLIAVLWYNIIRYGNTKLLKLIQNRLKVARQEKQSERHSQSRKKSRKEIRARRILCSTSITKKRNFVTLSPPSIAGEFSQEIRFARCLPNKLCWCVQSNDEIRFYVHTYTVERLFIRLLEHAHVTTPFNAFMCIIELGRGHSQSEKYAVTRPWGESALAEN